MKIGIIIQARADSKRYPKKIFKDLGGETIIYRVVGLVKKCENADKTILAIPKRDALYPFKLLDIKIFSGEEADVLKRMIDAAKANKLDAIVRVCADSPFILPWLIDYGIDIFKKNKIDYLFTKCFPIGQNIEIIRLSTLKKIYPLCNREEREHVTLYLENHKTKFVIKLLDIQFDVNTPDDLRQLEELRKYYE